jgi:predicted nucleic acid-binding protein
MPIIVDTSVWSLGLRRQRKDLTPAQKSLVFQLKELIIHGDAVMPGVVRQELLTGVAPRKFDEISAYLRAFDDPPMGVEDYERAARFSNLCTAAGIAASVPDVMICSLAGGNDWPILTTDADFARYSKHLPIHLVPLP